MSRARALLKLLESDIKPQDSGLYANSIQRWKLKPNEALEFYNYAVQEIATELKVKEFEVERLLSEDQMAGARVSNEVLTEFKRGSSDDVSYDLEQLVDKWVSHAASWLRPALEELGPIDISYTDVVKALGGGKTDPTHQWYLTHPLTWQAFEKKIMAAFPHAKRSKHYWGYNDDEPDQYGDLNQMGDGYWMIIDSDLTATYWPKKNTLAFSDTEE